MGLTEVGHSFLNLHDDVGRKTKFQWINEDNYEITNAKFAGAKKRLGNPNETQGLYEHVITQRGLRGLFGGLMIFSHDERLSARFLFCITLVR